MEKLKSLDEIFEKRLFRIPDYQRGYAWETKQLTDFWEDLLNMHNGSQHYTGLITISEATEEEWKKWDNIEWLIKERKYTPYYIVDGQQRLTTIIILLNEIINFVHNLECNKDKELEEINFCSYTLSEIKKKYICIKRPPNEEYNSYLFGYQIDIPSFDYLKYEIFGETISEQLVESLYTINLDNARKFFADNLLLISQVEGKNEIDIKKIEEIFYKITQDLKFNLYELENEMDVYVTFETMNNRGKKLSNLEILKNRLLYLITLYPENELPKDDYIDLKNDINNTWKEIYHQLGRRENESDDVVKLNDDEFLTDHWITYFNYTNQKGEAYIRYLLDDVFNPRNIFQENEITNNLKEIKENNDEETNEENEEIAEEDSNNSNTKLSWIKIKRYVTSLNDAAKYWYDSKYPTNSKLMTDEEAKWLEKINRIGVAYFRPIILASFMNKKIDSDQRVKLFKAIERFIFVAFRLGRAFSTYRNPNYYKKARELANNEITIDDICKSLKEDSNWVCEDTFNYGAFKDYINRQYKNGAGFYSWNGLKYFMFEYEEYIRQDKAIRIRKKEFFASGEKKVISIEHIYPQTPEGTDWEKTFDSKFTDEQKQILKGSLGNLLPLELSINIELQNDSFEDKKKDKFNEKGERIRRGYSNGSYSEIEVADGTFSDNNEEEWNEKTILNRGLALLDFMEKRWELKFASEKDKKDFLFLNFIKN